MKMMLGGRLFSSALMWVAAGTASVARAAAKMAGWGSMAFSFVGDQRTHYPLLRQQLAHHASVRDQGEWKAESEARFDEPAVLPAGVAEKMLAVTLEHRRRLALELERLTKPPRGRDREGELAIAVATNADLRLIEMAPRLVELIEQAHARV